MKFIGRGMEGYRLVRSEEFPDGSVLYEYESDVPPGCKAWISRPAPGMLWWSKTSDPNAWTVLEPVTDSDSAPWDRRDCV
jgi:hypothetical protein